MMTRCFKDLIVWQKAHSFVVLVYQATKSYPKFELFGLCSQFQRAAVSIPANIAEGYRRDGKADKLRFLNFAQGSLKNVATTSYCLKTFAISISKRMTY